MSDQDKTVVVARPEELLLPATRRKFLRAIALGGAAVFLPSMFVACSDDDDDPGPFTPRGSSNGDPAGTGETWTLNFASATTAATDLAVLNYAYALEQLEAAFYIFVAGQTGASNLTAKDKLVLEDIRRHEIAHRDVLRQLLGTAAILPLNVSSAITSLNYRDRATVLNTARTFEDLGVAAYNGVAQFLTADANIGLAGKIVSVEARHASTIRDLLNPAQGTTVTNANSFAPRAFDEALSPAAVGPVVAPYLVQKLNIQGTAGFVAGAQPNS